MAIGKSYLFRDSITYPNAYHRIDWLNWNGLNGEETEVNVGTYTEVSKAKTPEGKRTPQNAIDRRSFVLSVPKDKVGPAEAYKALSSLDEFKDGVEA